MMKGKEKAIIPKPTKAEDKGYYNGHLHRLFYPSSISKLGRIYHER